MAFVAAESSQINAFLAKFHHALIMETRAASKFDRFVLTLALLLGTGGMSSFYIKVFNSAPPLPTPVVEMPIYLLMILAVVVRFKDTVLGIITLSPMVPTVILILISYRWSLDPTITKREGVFYAVMFTYCATLAYTFTWRELIDILWKVCVFVCAFSILLFFAVPSIGKMAETHVGALSGMWMEKNLAGQVAVFSAIVALSRAAILPKTALSSLVSYLMFAAMLLLTTSKTCLVAFLIGSALFGWVGLMRRNIIVCLVTTTITVLILGPAVYLVSQETEAVLKLLGRNSTFSSRADIWRAIQFSISDRPRLGHGFAAYWSESYDFGTRHYVFKDLGFKAHSAHNSWYERELALGYIGKNLMSFEISLALFVAVIKVRRSKGSYFAIPLLIAAVIIGNFEAVLASITNFAGMLTVIVLAKSIRFTPLADKGSGLQEYWNHIRAASQDEKEAESKRQNTHRPGGRLTTAHSPQAVYRERRPPPMPSYS